MTLNLIPVEFSPRAAGEASGLTADAQRDWRKRGFIERTEGTAHARYDILSICRMTVLQAFSERGVGPRTVMDPGTGGASGIRVLAPAANALAWHVMGDSRAWMGGADALLGIRDELGLPGERSVDALVTAARSLAWDRFHLPEREGRFFVWWTGHEAETTDRLEATLDRQPDKRRAAPVFVLDLEVLGDAVRDRLPGPAFIIRRATEGEAPADEPMTIRTVPFTLDTE